jgi:uncharacterized protein YjiS (DUF1127 family)
MLWAWRTSGPIDPALPGQAAVGSGIQFGSMSIMSLLTMSILAVPRPRTSPRVPLIRTASDRRAQIKGLIVLICATVGRWMKRSRQRRALYEIAERDDHHLLKDIGVSREEAFREAGKPFWRQ